MITTFRIICSVVLVILGVGALYGGWMLMSEPSGDGFGWSVDLLEHTPFPDFLIPGIILFIVIGIFSLAIAVLTIMKVWRFDWLIILQGCILTVWLTTQIVLNREFFLPAMHYPTYAIALILIVLGILITRGNQHAAS